MHYYGFHIVESTGHGKRVKGEKETNSIQVRKWLDPDSYLLKKSFSYPVADAEKKDKAVQKAN